MAGSRLLDRVREARGHCTTAPAPKTPTFSGSGGSSSSTANVTRLKGEAEVQAFLTHLAFDGRVATSLQDQAMGAWLLLDKAVLNRLLVGRIERWGPTVLGDPGSPLWDDVRALIDGLGGVPGLAASLHYGSGLQLMEGLRLRVPNADFGQDHLLIHDGKE
jgi:hypothetical protein